MKQNITKSRVKLKCCLLLLSGFWMVRFSNVWDYNFGQQILANIVQIRRFFNWKGPEKEIYLFVDKKEGRKRKRVRFDPQISRKSAWYLMFHWKSEQHSSDFFPPSSGIASCVGTVWWTTLAWRSPAFRLWAGIAWVVVQWCHMILLSPFLVLFFLMGHLMTSL